MKSIVPERYAVSLFDKPSAPPAAKPNYSAWQFNVVDEYKEYDKQTIQKKVAENLLPYAVLMTHINIDYNLSSVLRLGNAMGAKVFYYGSRKWDKRGALGVYHYTPITHLKTIEDVAQLKKQYSFVALEQAPGAVNLPSFVWPKSPLILLGEESRGLQATPEIFSLAEHFIKIQQRGSVRSLNAASAFAIAAYDFSTKLGAK